jgi:xanthine dehydrogenase YagR molybdenum-binding subunit
MALSWPDRKTTKYLSKDTVRIDGPDKVSGRAKYTFDINLPGLLQGKILRCPHAVAEVVSIDTSKAKAMKGVLAVIDDLGKNCRYAGDEIAAVAAETEEIARDAIKAIVVNYKVGEHVVTTETGMKIADRVGRSRDRTEGDVNAAFTSAAAVVEGEYSVPIREHLSLETHGVVVRWDADDELTCWISTQAVHGSAGDLSAALGIPRDKVKTICEVMGGGFGSKFSAGVEGLSAARLAKMAGRPVKMMLERYDEQVASGNGPDARMKCKASMDASGKLTAMEAELWGTQGTGKRWSVPFPYIYDVPNLNIAFNGVSTNTGGARSLRAPGHPQGSFLMETVVDELARKLNLDPVAVRKMNQTSDVRNAQLDLGAERIGWARKSALPRTGRYRRGLGVATSTWGGGGGGGSQCDVRIGQDGGVTVSIGTQDLGTGTRTYVATIVAEVLGLPLSKVTADIGKSTLPPSQGSGGSVTTASVSPAVMSAASAAKDRLSTTASAMLGDDLSFADGKISSGSSGKSASFDEVCAKLPAAGIQERGAWDRNLAQGGVAGAQFAEVEVDTWTGHIRVVRVVAVQDCGYVINKLTCESQVIGGVIQGVGMALLEQALWDEQTGRMLNPNMETYKPPGSMEIPEIDVVLYETHDKVTGVGEPVVIPTAAAIGNAVFDGCGVRLRHLPMTPKAYFDAQGAKR